MEAVQEYSFLNCILIGTISSIIIVTWFVGMAYKLNYRWAMRTLTIRETELNHEREMSALDLKNQEVFRERIAADLHDSLGALFFSSRVNAILLKEYLLPKAEAERLRSEIERGMQMGLSSVKETILDLTPVSFKNSGLSESLFDLCFRTQRYGCEIEFSEIGNRFNWADERALQVFRIVQELVHNAAKHSKSINISVHCEWQVNSLLIVVTDYGTGFDDREANNGLGIWNMRQRARHLNAFLTIRSNTGMPGTQARLMVKYTDSSYYD